MITDKDIDDYISTMSMPASLSWLKIGESRVFYGRPKAGGINGGLLIYLVNAAFHGPSNKHMYALVYGIFIPLDFSLAQAYLEIDRAFVSFYAKAKLRNLDGGDLGSGDNI